MNANRVIPWKFIVGALVLLAVPALGVAQTGTGAATVPLVIPDGPLLAAVPDYSKWTIVLSYPEDRDKTKTPAQLAGLGVRTRSIVTTRYAKIVHEEYIDNQGGKLEKWYVGGIQYSKPNGTTTWFQNQSGSDPGPTPLPPSKLRDLEWISKDTYAGTVNYANHSCLIFVPGGASNLNVADSATLAEKLTTLLNGAFIDATTRLPIEVRQAGVISTYTFQKQDETTENPLPPDLLSQLKQGAEGRDRLNQAASRPY